MENKSQSQYCSLEEFDQEVSLWQLFPAGDGKGLRRLKLIVDAILNGQIQNTSKPLSVLIVGKPGNGKRSHARAFLRALGVTNITEIPSSLLSLHYSLSDHIASQQTYDGLLLTNVEHSAPFFQHTLYHYLEEGRYYAKNITKYDEAQFSFDIYHGICPIVLTTAEPNRIPLCIKDTVNHIVTIEPYTREQLKLVILQRLIYCHRDYEGEDVLEKITEYGMSGIDRSIYILKLALTVMNSEGENMLLLKHVERAIKLL